MVGLAPPVTDTARRGRDVVDAITVPIAVWSRDGDLIHYNAALLALTGYSASEIAALNPEELVGEEQRAGLCADIELARSGVTPSARRCELTVADGRPRSVAISVASVDFGGEPGAVLFQLVDISPQLEIARRLEKLEALEGVVASGVHDFGNLVTAILGNIEFAQSESDPAPWLKRAKRASVSASDLVRRVLRPASPAQTEAFDLGALAVDSVDLVRVTSDPAIEFRVRCSVQGPFMVADRCEIERVLINVLTNARDAVQERLSGEEGAPRPPHIDIDVREQCDESGSYAELVVTDAGVGMSAELCERIFDPFFTTKRDGTGLGMVSVSRIVAEHRGTVSVESTLNEGTVVTLRFPSVMRLPDAELAAG